MNLEGYRTLFIVATLGLTLMVASPTISMIVPIRGGSEQFSEFWLRGAADLAKDYPFNIIIGDEYNVSVGVGNHMGCSQCYIVYVKFRNQTQPLPDSLNSMPSSLNFTYEFQVFLADKETWESLLIFSFRGEPMFISNISINGVVFPVNCSSTWDSHNNGFFYQLFFELWMYDESSSSFRYQNQFVGIWLNMTRRETPF